LENIYLKLQVNGRIKLYKAKNISGNWWQGEGWWKRQRKLEATDYKVA
jgi:hypothetical protein